MIGYVTLGTNDLARAAKFYDALLGELGGKRVLETDQFISWSSSPGSPGLGLIKPFDKKAATPGNGTMVALAVDSQDKVKAVYDKAMKLGAKDEGGPWLRWGTFYAAYFRDLNDHIMQVTDTVDSFRDLLNGMLDSYYATISTRTNAVLKVLALFSAIFMPLTFITGIFGMNFVHFPELE